MKKSFVFPIVFMAILTAVFTFVLSFLNYSTADRIEFNEQNDRRKKILYVFDIETDSDDPQEIARVYEENLEIMEKDGEEVKIEGENVYIQRENGDIKAYAIPVRGAGLWGSILGYVGISEDYSEMIGVDFIAHSETPGLGGRIDELEYKEQFRGLEIDEEDSGNYLVYRPASGGNVDSISGATSTSKAVVDIINADLQNFIENVEVE